MTARKSLDQRKTRPNGKSWVYGRGLDRYCGRCGHYQHASYPPADCHCDATGCHCHENAWMVES